MQFQKKLIAGGHYIPEDVSECSSSTEELTFSLDIIKPTTWMRVESWPQQTVMDLSLQTEPVQLYWLVCLSQVKIEVDGFVIWILKYKIAGRTTCCICRANMHTWLSSCFMYDDKVGNVVGFTGMNKCRYLMVSSVHALGSREHQLYFL